MATFRSNLNSINNNVLRFERHNDAHSDDALEILLTNIYTTMPSAVIVEQGVVYRTATTDFQAWAIYYNPNEIFNPAAPNNLEIISQYKPENIFAYTGTFTILDDTQINIAVFAPGNYFCIDGIDYESISVEPVLSTPTPFNLMATILDTTAFNNIAATGTYQIALEWQVLGVTYRSNFVPTMPGGIAAAASEELPSLDPIVVMMPTAGTITGAALPALGTTGRWGLLLTDYKFPI